MQLAKAKEWREARGHTQRSLAAESGVSEVTIARLETGHGTTPSTALKLANALNVEVVDLLENPPALAGSGKGRAPDTGPTKFTYRFREDFEGVDLEDVHAMGVAMNGSELTVLNQLLHYHYYPPEPGSLMVTAYVKKKGEDVDQEKIKTALARIIADTEHPEEMEEADEQIRVLVGAGA
jgi:transcriptional regulator with XRE-family HTH domain